MLGHALLAGIDFAIDLSSFAAGKSRNRYKKKTKPNELHTRHKKRATHNSADCKFEKRVGRHLMHLHTNLPAFAYGESLMYFYACASVPTAQ